MTDDHGDDDTDAPHGVAPKLTIAQRLLTALPNLQRQPPPAASATRTNGSATDVDHVDDTDAGETAGSDDVTTDSAANGAVTPRARLRDAFLKPAPTPRPRPADALADMSREEIAHRIKKLDDRERQLALMSAPIGIAVGLLLTGFTLHLNPAVHAKGHVSPSLILLEGGARILLSGLVVAAALTRRRSLVGFSLLFLGTAMGSPLFALPFWGLGGYLIWRVFKYQKILNARGGAAGRSAGRSAGRTPARTTGRATGGSRVPANPRAAVRAGSTAGRNRAQAARQRGRKQPEPAGPTPSKRYTPPKPTRPRPPAPPT